MLTSGDEVADRVMPALRAALNGSGPALLLTPADRPGERQDGEPAAARQDGGPAAARQDSGSTGGRRDGGPMGARRDGGTAMTAADDDATDPTAVAVTTSGSTGHPKTVLLPASSLLASASATHDRLGGAGHWLLALPVYHVAGLQVLVRSLIAGTRPAVLDPAARFTPEAFSEAAGRVGGSVPATRTAGARRYTALVPTQLTRLLTAAGDEGARALEALRGFDAVLVGGAPIPPALRKRAAGAGVRLVTTYGASETCGGCVYDGTPLDGVEIRFDDEGRVLLGGPVLARGYLDDPAGTARAFVTGPDGRRWFRTDDAGRLAGGRLQVTGRLDAVVITGGVNVAPAAVEAALHRLPGVAEAVVVGLPDPEWGQRVAAALVLAPGARPPSLAEVRARVSAEVSAAAAPRQLTLLPALPALGPGKPDRAAIARELANRPATEEV